MVTFTFVPLTPLNIIVKIIRRLWITPGGLSMFVKSQIYLAELPEELVRGFPCLLKLVPREPKLWHLDRVGQVGKTPFFVVAGIYGGGFGLLYKHQRALCSYNKIKKMAAAELDGCALDAETLKPNESTISNGHLGNLLSPLAQSSVKDDDDGMQITCFSEDMNNTTFHFQIIRLHKQIYAWIGCNSAKFGHLYAAAPTRPNNSVGVTSILGGASDNPGSSIARRLALKSGLNIILACNIPKNSPMLEADAERILVQKLISLGYTRSKSHLPPPMVGSAQ